jgi:hypothetical protein
MGHFPVAFALRHKQGVVLCRDRRLLTLACPSEPSKVTDRRSCISAVGSTTATSIAFESACSRRSVRGATRSWSIWRTWNSSLPQVWLLSSKRQGCNGPRTAACCFAPCDPSHNTCWTSRALRTCLSRSLQCPTPGLRPAPGRPRRTSRHEPVPPGTTRDRRWTQTAFQRLSSGWSAATPGRQGPLSRSLGLRPSLDAGVGGSSEVAAGVGEGQTDDFSRGRPCGFLGFGFALGDLSGPTGVQRRGVGDPRGGKGKRAALPPVRSQLGGVRAELLGVRTCRDGQRPGRPHAPPDDVTGNAPSPTVPPWWRGRTIAPGQRRCPSGTGGAGVTGNSPFPATPTDEGYRQPAVTGLA